MKRASYGQRDYAFGEAMLTLRTAIGLTQVGLAEYLGVSRQAVGDWEAGKSYPKAHHLQRFITLAMQQQAFPPGREAEEIRALWKAGRQKVLLDEQWLSTLLGCSPASLSLVAPLPVASVPARPSVPARAASEPRVDWGPDGSRLAGAGTGRDGGELFIWEIQGGEHVQTFAEHPGVVYAVTWSPSEDLLVSGGSEGILHW